MTPEQFLVDLRARGVEVRTQDSRLVIRPASQLTTDERAFVRSHSDTIAALLATEEAARVSADLDVELATIAGQDEVAEERNLAALMTPSRAVVLYRTTRGAMVPLNRLSSDDVQQLRRRGSLTDDELRTWLKSRTTRSVLVS